MILCFYLCTPFPFGYYFFKIMTSWLILTSFCDFWDFLGPPRALGPGPLGPRALPNAQRNPTGTWHFPTLNVDGWRSRESPSFRPPMSRIVFWSEARDLISPDPELMSLQAHKPNGPEPFGCSGP